MTRVARCAAAIFVLASAFTLLVGAAAAATTPPPSPGQPQSKVVVYAGTGVTTNPSHPEYATHAETLPASATVDCTGSPCTIVSIVTDTTSGNVIYDLTDGRKVPLPGGKTSVAVAGHANAGCVDGEVPPGQFGATASGDTVTVTFAFGGQSEYNCPDGSTVETPPGYVFTAVLTATSGSPCVITGTCPTPTPTPTASAAPASDSAPLRITPHPVKIDEPSTLSVLPTVAVAVNPANVLWAVAATVVLVLLIALPSHLLNTATETGSDRVSEWWKGARARVRDATGRDAAAATPARQVDDPPPQPVNFAGWPIAAAGVLAASLISSFIDPSFGFNAASLRVFLSILLSFLLDAVAGWFLLILFVRRANPSATARFRFAPASLIVVIIAVLFTRLTGFQPGIVFGLVAGVVFGAVLAASEKARLALITLGYSFVLAVIGWIGYSAISSSAGAHPAAGVVFVQETLSAVAIGGIAALPIALVPLRGLAGYEIWSWNRGAWAGAYAVGLIGFFVVLMPKPFSWATVNASVWTWAAIYAAYALGAVVLWLIAARPWRNAEA
ncbi:MAG: hypothetical protein ABIO06_06770 [Pseudolysinimonas sp.]